jgi:glycosyltransferase involved in cell wall biosynthesis
VSTPRRSLSLCAWACNEAPIVELFVQKTVADLARVSDDFELIVVDDGSTDGTLEKLHALQPSTPQLRVVSHGRNRGYGACFDTTLRLTTKDVVLWNTVDMFFDTAELPAFLARLDEFDLVQGVRTDLEANPLRGKLNTVVNYWLIRVLFGIPMSEFQNVKVFRRWLLDRIELQAQSGFVNAEIGIKAHYLGARMTEVPMTFQPRRGGQPKPASAAVVWGTLSDVFGLWFQWVVLRRAPRAPVRHPVVTLPARAWGKAGFPKGRTNGRY